MIFPLRALRFLAVALLPLSAGAVRAGEIDGRVDLVCNAAENLALVRFSLREDDAPAYPRLPPALDHGLSAGAGSGRSDCTLADGTTIRVRGGQEQGFAYGLGGANPPAFFSLWINQHKVLSRKVWKPGYGESLDNPPVYDGVLIAANRITTCATADGKGQRCSSQPINLAKSPVDDVEYAPAGQKAVVGQFSVIAKGAGNQRFCKDYLGSIKPGIEAALRGQRTSLDFDLELAALQQDLPARFGAAELTPGASRRVMVWAGESRAFDGTVIAMAPRDAAPRDILAAYPFDDIDAWPKRGAPSGVTLISGGQKQLYPDVSPRFVHLAPQRISGALYFFAYPTNGKVRPTAALVKPLADGGFITLCAFNRTEPHY